jgi:CubicO group peptidase (beta-lactamase class C family)
VAALLPATPAGHGLGVFLEHFNTGDPATYRTMLDIHFKEESTDRAVAWYRMLFHDCGGLDVVRVQQAEDHKITVLARPRLYDGWMEMAISVEPEAPHRIASVWPNFRGRPADLNPGHPIDDASLAGQLDDFLHHMAEADRFSGTVVVARGGRTIFQQAYGLASKAHGVANQLNTRFNLGSMNKMFTGVATVQLAQAGLLSLTDTVAKVLPDWPEPAASQVTVHHLLTHTSGMGSYWNQQFEERKARLRTVSDFLPLFQNEPPAFEPGARFRYSNSGFMLLGAIIERVTGQSYYDYVREHIYTPAGMADTDCYELDQDVPNLATGYTHRDISGALHFDRWFNNLFLHVVRGGPAGGGYATAPDMLRFAAALLGHKLLDPAHTEMVLTGKVDAGPGMSYGYGFFDDRSNGVRVVGHAGGFHGINSVLDMYPDLDATVVVMGNYDPPAARVNLKVQELLTQG